MGKSRHNILKNRLIDFLSKNEINKYYTLFNRVVGNVYFKRGGKFVGPYKAGVKGQCDLYLYGLGETIEIELKGSKDRLSKDQKKWIEFCIQNDISIFVLHEDEWEESITALKACLNHSIRKYKKRISGQKIIE